MPGEGTWTVNPKTGEVTFTPEKGFSKDPTPIDYTVKDKAGNTSNPATITVDYPQNPPVAEDDTKEGNVGDSVVINVLGNDKDPDGDLDPASVQLIDPETGKPTDQPVKVPGEGTWTVNPKTGEVTFTPEKGFSKDPTPIDYTVKDKAGNTSNPATITVDYQSNPQIIIPPNEPTDPAPVDPTDPDTPINEGNPATPENPNGAGDKTVYEGDGPVEGSFTIDKDPASTITNIKVGGTDIPVDKDGNITETSIDTGKGTLVITGYNPETGEVTYTYDPEVQDHTTDAPVMDNIEIVVTDSNDKTGTDSLDIAITDSAPVAKDDSNSVDEDATDNTATGNVIDNDVFGADGQGTPAVTPIADQALEYGTITINEDGTYTYTLDNTNDAVNALNDDETLTDTVEYTITDGDGDTTTAKLTITINGRTDEAPQVVIPPNEPTDPAPVDPTDPDTPVNEGNPATPENPNGAGDKTVYEGDGPVEGSFTINKDPAATITNIKVGGTDIPVDKDGNITETTIDTGKGTLVITGYNPETGEVSYTYDPEVQDHTTDAPVMDNIEIVVTDSNDKTGTDSLDIAITDSAPVAKDDSNSVDEDAEDNTVTGNVIDNDVFGADGQGIPAVTPIANQALKYGSITINEDGTYTYTLDNDNSEVNALNDDETLTDTVEYTITDGDGDTTTATLTITINGHTDGEPDIKIPVDPEVPGTPENEGAPEGFGDKIVYEGDDAVPGTFTVTAEAGVDTITVGGQEIQDATADNPVTITRDAGTLVITGYDATTGEVSYTYDPEVQDHTGSEPNVDSYAVVVTDKNGVSSNDSLDIVITDSLPQAADDANSVTEDAENTVSGNVTDNDNFGLDGEGTPAVTPIADQALKYGSITINKDGTYTYTLDNDNSEVNALNDDETLTDTVEYTITDGDGDTTTATLTITINGHTDGEPDIKIPVDPEVPGTPENEGAPEGFGDKIVYEGDDAVPGTFTVTAEAGVDTITVGGQEIQDATADNPVTITRDAGTLVITGYDATTGEVSYTYDPEVQDHTGSEPNVDSYAVVVTDKNGVSSNDSLDIVITDSLPQAADDANSVTEDAENTVSGNVTDNDNFGLDGEGTPAVTPIADQALKYGSITINKDGTYTYTLDNDNSEVNALNDDETLTDTVEYTITDGDGDTTTATLTITINGHTDGEPDIKIPVDPEVPGTPENEGAPEGFGDKIVYEGDDAVPGTFTVTAEAGVDTITVGGQEIQDATADNPVTITRDAGTLVITGYDATTGEVSYTYDPEVQDHTGSEPNVDSYAVVVTDKNGVSSNDSLDIVITDSLPQAADDANSVTEDAENTVSGNVTDNDNFGLDGEGTPAVTPIADQALKYGSITINKDGTYTYTLDNDNSEVNALNDDETLTDTVEYTITDGDGDTTTATLTITINGHTDGEPDIKIPVDPEVPGTPENEGAPEGFGDKIVYEGDDAVPGTFTVTAEAGVDTITVGGQEIQDATADNPVTITRDAGTLVITGYDATTGEVSYTYDPEVQDHTGSEPNVDSYAVVVTDKNGVSSNDSLDIVITDSLPQAADDANSVTEDAENTVSGNVTDNDNFGLDGEGTPAVTPIADQALKYGSITINKDGTYTYTLDNDNSEVNALNDDETLTDTVEYTITDGDGDTTTATLTITINGHTDGEPDIKIPVDPEVPGTPENEGAPEGFGDKIVYEGDDAVPGTFTVTAEAGVDTITVGGQEIQDATADNPVTITRDAGTLVITGYDATTGEVSYTYDPEVQDHTGSEPNVDSYAVVVTDKNGVSSNDSLDIVITDSLPQAADDANSVTEDAENTVSGNVTDNDNFGLDGEGTPAVTPIADQALKYGSITINKDGTYTYTLDNDNSEVNALNDDETLTDTVEYTITDGDGDTTTATLTITINGHDDPTEIKLGPTPHVSEERLPNGNPDNSPKGIDTTNELKSASTINIKDVDTDLSEATVVFITPPEKGDITSKGLDVEWVKDPNKPNDWIGQKTDTEGNTKEVIRLSVAEKGVKQDDDSYNFDYTVTLSDQVDHPNPQIEDNLDIHFDIEVRNGETVLATITDKAVAVVEDDSPVAYPVIYNIDVPIDTIQIKGLETGFVETEFTNPASNFNVATQLKDINGSRPGTGQTAVEAKSYARLNSYGQVIERNIERAQQDTDDMDEGVYWGGPYYNAGNYLQPAGYETHENEVYTKSGVQLTEGVDSFKLGTFTHENYTVALSDGVLKDTTLRVQFDFTVNGEASNIVENFKMYHIETPNTRYDVSQRKIIDMKDIYNPGYSSTTADDFVVIDTATDPVVIGGKEYRLKLEGFTPVEGSGLGEGTEAGLLHDSVQNYEYLLGLKIYYTQLINYYSQVLNTGGYAQDQYNDANFQKTLFTNARDAIDRALNSVTREQVENGDFLIVNSPERGTNTFDIEASFTPLIPTPELKDNLVISEKILLGGDIIDFNDPEQKAVVWSTTDEDVIDITNPKVGVTEFASKYGVFTASKDGSYFFTAAKDIRQQVDLNEDDVLTFNYTYSDYDGDTVESTVVLNFNDYARPKPLQPKFTEGTEDYDYIVGTEFADTLKGGDGNDTLVGLAGADTLLGEGGDDRIYYNPEAKIIDGGEGKDTLIMDESKVSYDKFDFSNVHNIEVIDTKDGVQQNISLSVSDVTNMTDENNTLFVKGDSNDSYKLTGFTESSSDQTGYSMYTGDNGVTLYIDTEITNIIL
ncbi:hypothetical protein A6J60_011580 [Psychrobacter sp. FDAARGOS_221]|nr:hypothetical protein A6J60_011580 [Psychrobacter sp. FDAARGOS_221]